MHVNTDVVVIIVGKFRSHFQKMLISGMGCVWYGKTLFLHLAILMHLINDDLGREKSLALSVFHSFTGCETIHLHIMAEAKSQHGKLNWNVLMM